MFTFSPSLSKLCLLSNSSNIMNVIFANTIRRLLDFEIPRLFINRDYANNHFLYGFCNESLNADTT